MNNKTIMIIEDEELLLSAINTKLLARGYKTVPCKSAEDALSYLNNTENIIPDAIWLDYYLPGMDGSKFAESLKKSERLKDVPIVVVSNSASDQKKEAMLKFGIKKYVLKAEHKLEDIIQILESEIEHSNG